MKANLTSMFLGKHGQRSAAVLSAVLSAMAVLPAAAAENYIPGAQNTPSSLPLYLNNPDMYYPDAVGGVCWATANTDIFAYWDRNAYNGVIYWNLVDNGTAPQREPALPTAPGHEQGDVQSVVNWLAHQYYGLERGDEAAILTEFANDSNGLSFTISYHGPADTTSAKTSLFNIMKAEIDAGRPFSAGSWGTYFGGAHQVPVMGYKEMANIADSTIYIHRNTGGTGTEYVNFFASAWSNLDMDKIVPGGTPVDNYEALGDNTAATAVTIEPDDVYGFRQTHNFSFAGDADWIGLSAVAGRTYTMATRSLGASCDTVLQLYSSNGTTLLAQDDDGGGETGASKIEWDCTATGTVYLRVTEKASRAGHAAKYDIQVSHDGAVVPPGVIDLQNGVAVANLSEAQGSTAREYRLAVPAGATGLQISISGGSGDCDMYVKFGSRATQSNYDYRPYVGGNNETVTVSNPTPGDWYIMLHGFSAYSGVTLQASYTPPPTAPAITTSSPLPSGTAGAAYSVTLAASGGTTPYSWALASGSLPAGLSLSGGGVISGTPTASGTSSFTVRVTGGNSLSSTQAFSLTIGTGPVTVSLPTALDAADLTFTTGGSAIWFGQTATAHDGADAAQSGVIGHSQSTYMEITVSGPGTLSFWWKVSSESNWDWLRFYIDGAEQAGAISGSVDWQQKSYAIPSGSHTLRWQYTKDVSLSSGSDCGWVDQVVWAPSVPPAITTSSPLPAGTVGTAYNVTLAASGGTAPYSWSLASGSLPAGLSLSGGGVISGTPAASGTSSFTVRVTGGNSLSSTQAFSLTVGASPVTVSLPTALDTANLTLTTGGSAFWFGQTATAHDGADSAQSGDIGESQTSYMETTVSGPGTISFWWKVSSEINWDWLSFSIDGNTPQVSMSGASEWEQESYAIPSGNHTLRWQYSKDGSVSSGSDCGWVDQVVWTRSTYYTLTVYSWNPDSGVEIRSATGHGGTTDYSKTVSAGETINLEAPEFVGSGASRKRFVSWDSNCSIGDPIRNQTFQYDTECGDENGNMWVCANYEDAPEQDGYLCDPAGDAALETVGTYDGYLYADRAFGAEPVPAVLGTINVKLTKVDGKLTAKAVVQAGTVSFSGKAWAGQDGNGTLYAALTTRGGETLNLYVRQNRIWGTVSGGKFGAGEIYLEGSRTRFADKKDPEAQAVLNRYKGYYTATLCSACRYPGFIQGSLNAAPQGNGYLTLTVNTGGKVRIAGMLADGTGVSQSAQLLYFADCGDWLCVPFYVPLYRKAGYVSALLWIDPETRGIYCGAETGDSVRWEKPGAGPDGFTGLLELWGGPYNQTPVLQTQYAFESALDWDLATYYYAGGAAECAFVPEGIPVTVSGTKMKMPKAGRPVKITEDGETWYEYEGDNPAGATLSFTARTGIFKGTFKLYYDYYDQKDRFQHKTVSVPYAGVMLQDLETGTLTEGAGYALFPSNDPDLKPYKIKPSFPVWIWPVE